MTRLPHDWREPLPNAETPGTRQEACRLCPLLDLVDDVGGVLELRHAREGRLQNYVGDAGGRVLLQVGGPEFAGLPPAEPPLLAQILEVVHLAAAFPIDVDGAQSFTAKYAGGEAAVDVGEDKYGVPRRIGARPGGKLRQVGSVQTRVVHHAAQHGDGEESGDGYYGRPSNSGERGESAQREGEADGAPDEGPREERLQGQQVSEGEPGEGFGGTVRANGTGAGGGGEELHAEGEKEKHAHGLHQWDQAPMELLQEQPGEGHGEQAERRHAPLLA